MSTTAQSGSKGPADNTATKQPQLSALVEDDEFEEFPVEDWDDSESTLAVGANGRASAGDEGGKKVKMEDLWEDNWDDDVMESDFAKQLRTEIEKTKSSGSGAGPMQT